MDIKEIKFGLKYYLLNTIVNHIPCWTVRKLFYQLAGMKIGKSHILMGVITDGWRNIKIGDGVCINQYCYIDGRGGLEIKDNVSISTYCKVVTGSHDMYSHDFKYISEKTIIEERTWLGIGCIVLPGAHIGEGCVIAAGSIATKKDYGSFRVYAGIPAQYIKNRNVDLNYNLSKWNPIFR